VFIIVLFLCNNTIPAECGGFTCRDHIALYLMAVVSDGAQLPLTV